MEYLLLPWRVGLARKKKNVDDFVDREPTPDVQLTRKSGWCLTGYDKDCPYQFSFGKCGCECHTN